MEDAREQLESVVNELDQAVRDLEQGTVVDADAADLVTRIAALSARIGELIPVAMRERAES
jgi:glyoxylate carboligase